MIIWSVLVGYLLGSVSFALLIGGAAVRTTGSGNLGAANVLRVRRTSLGLLVLVLDMAKGGAPVWLARAFGANEAMVVAAGLAAIVGHIYPAWLRFRGGKGVATTFGVFTAVSPPAVQHWRMGTRVRHAMFSASDSCTWSDSGSSRMNERPSVDAVLLMNIR